MPAAGTIPGTESFVESAASGGPGTAVPARRAPAALFFVLCATGAVIAAFSTRETLEIHRQGIGVPSFCSVNTWLDCRAALASHHAFFRGVPVSWFAFLYFVWGAGVALVAGLWRRSVGMWPALSATTGFALLVGLGQAALMVTDIQVLCPTCLAQLLVIVALTAVCLSQVGWSASVLLPRVWTVVRRAYQGLERSLELRRAGLPLLLLALILVAGVGSFRAVSGTTVVRERVMLLEAMERIYRAPAHDLRLPERVPRRGPDEAPVKLVIFGDFECGACRKVASVVRPFGMNVQSAFVNFPLTSGLTPRDSTGTRTLAVMAARGAVLARQHGFFWEYHDVLFEHQGRLDEEFIRKALEDRGTPADEIDAALRGEGVDDSIREDVALGDKHGVRGTPTLFVNGHRLAGYSAPLLKMMIRHELGAGEHGP